LRSPLAKIAVAPAVTIAVEPNAHLELLLAQAAHEMGAPRIIAVWEKTEETKRYFACWSARRFERSTESLEYPIEGLVAPRLARTTFAVRSAESQLVKTPEGLRFSAAAAISARFSARYDIRAVVSTPFFRRGCRGRIFALDCAFAKDQLAQITIVADRVGLAIEYDGLQQQAEATVAARERLKLAHDLHDGLLQNLTAATLQLEVCSKNCEGEIRQRIDSIQALLAGEQRRLRDVVNGWRHRNRSEDLFLADACENVLRGLGAYWNCQTSLRIRPRNARLPFALVEHLSLLLTEAIANAVKHGNASRVWVYVARTTQTLALFISDNGGGFRGLVGSYSDDTLVAENIGPRSLCERVKSLRGHLLLATSGAGARVRIQLPLEKT